MFQKYDLLHLMFQKYNLFDLYNLFEKYDLF